MAMGSGRSRQTYFQNDCVFKQNNCPIFKQKFGDNVQLISIMNMRLAKFDVVAI